MYKVVNDYKDNYFIALNNINYNKNPTKIDQTHIISNPTRTKCLEKCESNIDCIAVQKKINGCKSIFNIGELLSNNSSYITDSIYIKKLFNDCKIGDRYNHSKGKCEPCNNSQHVKSWVEKNSCNINECHNNFEKNSNGTKCINKFTNTVFNHKPPIL